MGTRGADKARTQVRTQLAELRLYRNLTQRQLAMYAGIPLSSYRRLERGQNDNPPLRWLVNLWHVLGLSDDLYALIEDEWLEWKQLSPNAPREHPNIEFPGDPDSA